MLGLLTAIGRTDITADTMILSGKLERSERSDTRGGNEVAGRRHQSIVKDDHRHPATVDESIFYWPFNTPSCSIGDYTQSVTT